MNKIHIHNWVPLSIDEEIGYIYYFCIDCDVIGFKKIKYVDNLTTEEEINNKEYGRITRRKI